MESNQIISMTSVFFVMTKDCTGAKAKQGFNVGNIFLLNPISQNRSILISDTAMLQEFKNFNVSLEIHNGNTFKEIFINNVNT